MVGGQRDAMGTSSLLQNTIEPGHSISYKIAPAPSEYSDQPAHPRNLIRVYTVRLKMISIFGYQKSVL